MQKVLSATDIAQMTKPYRTNLINSLPGFRGANLIGTISAEKRTNLAIFNSVTHIGANPALMGLIMRPVSEENRHTYANIKATGQFTINHVHQLIVEKAHQTSARYPVDVSEFDACGLSPAFSELLQAPYVAESFIQIGLELADEIPITLNQTILIIGKVLEIRLEEKWLAEDGFIRLDQAGSLAVAGLEGYAQPQELVRYAHAKPNQAIQRVAF